MIVDGAGIAQKIYRELGAEVAKLKTSPSLTVFTCAPAFETQKYLNLKRKKAEMVGIDFQMVDLPRESKTEDFLEKISESQNKTDAIVVQLPLPSHIDTLKVLEHIPPSHDVDALNPATEEFLSPVVEAVREILETHDISPEGKKVSILGRGILVGLPVSKWFAKRAAQVRVHTSSSEDIGESVRDADIVVSGVGVPGFITPEMIGSHTILLDAGTSEDNGELRGDAHPDCAHKAALFTPVPGGIGPITIAVLLRNVVKAISRP